MALRATHTFAIMEVTQATYDEIFGKLKAAGYEHAILEREDEHGTCLDMHGIALALVPRNTVPEPTPGDPPAIA